MGGLWPKAQKMRIFPPTTLVFFVFLFFLTGLSPVSAVDDDPDSRERKGELQQRLMARGFSAQYLNQVFSDSRVTLYPEIVQRQGKSLNYTGRRFGLLSKKSVKQGRNVLRTHERILRRIQTAYGVGGEILVAILRIETNFGRYVGNYPIFNSLLTMTLIENRRSSWADEELGHLLWFCREEKKDPLSVKGSWAGAFGIPQFIPSSYIKYGVDGNGDGLIDLQNLSDALASTANYLKTFGWSQDEPVRKKEALFAYNHCDHYVQAVLTYARALTR
jgi:membrane-bound lytic murein transglycosylase B